MLPVSKLYRHTEVVDLCGNMFAGSSLMAATMSWLFLAASVSRSCSIEPQVTLVCKHEHEYIEYVAEKEGLLSIVEHDRLVPTEEDRREAAAVAMDLKNMSVS